MDESKISLFLALHGEKFSEENKSKVKEKLKSLDDSRFISIATQDYQKPDFVQLMAIFSLDRLVMGRIELTIAKLLTCGGCGIWWLLDLLNAKKNADVANFEKFTKASS